MTPRPSRFTTRENAIVHIVQVAGWAPGPSGVQTPKRPAGIVTLHRLCCPNLLLYTTVLHVIMIVIMIINHHHLANMQLGHLLPHSGLTRTEVSSIASRGSFCLLVCSFFIILGNLLRGILFTCSNQFLLYSHILSKTESIRRGTQKKPEFCNKKLCI